MDWLCRVAPQMKTRHNPISKKRAIKAVNPLTPLENLQTSFCANHNILTVFSLYIFLTTLFAKKHAVNFNYSFMITTPGVKAIQQ